MKQYDTTFIIDGSLDQAQRENLIDKFEKSLEKFGGKLDRTVRWGLRELAYEINKRTHGYYVMFYFNAEPSVIKSFESELNLNENILRYMTLLFDGKHPDYIKDETGQDKEATASKVIPEPEKEENIEVSDDELSDDDVSDDDVTDDDVSDDEVSEIVEDNPENDEVGNVAAEETDTAIPDIDTETGDDAEAEDVQKKEAE